MAGREHGRHRAIIVLGMHRSGTSALSGVLRILGVELGSNLFVPEPGVNDKGFWEHAEIVATHDRLLSEFQSRWDDVSPLPDNWWKSEKAGRYAGEIKRILDREFRDKALWSVKDPRMCRLLPLWIEILEEIGVDPVFVLMLRHPVEVARSLERRDGFGPDKSHALWLDHLCSSVKWSMGRPRVLVTYDELLQDWRGAFGSMEKELGIQWPIKPAEVSEEIDAYVEPGLRHHRTQDPDQGLGAVPSWVAEVYVAISANRALDDETVQARILFMERQLVIFGDLYGSAWRSLARRFEEVGEGFSRAVAFIEEREKELAAKNALIEEMGAGFSQAVDLLKQQNRELHEKREELGSKKAELAYREAELALMRSSRMWRLGQWIGTSRAGRMLGKIGRRTPPA